MGVRRTNYVARASKEARHDTFGLNVPRYHSPRRVPYGLSRFQKLLITTPSFSNNVSSDHCITEEAVCVDKGVNTTRNVEKSIKLPSERCCLLLNGANKQLLHYLFRLTTQVNHLRSALNFPHGYSLPVAPSTKLIRRPLSAPSSIRTHGIHHQHPPTTLIRYYGGRWFPLHLLYLNLSKRGYKHGVGDVTLASPTRLAPERAPAPTNPRTRSAKLMAKRGQNVAYTTTEERMNGFS